MVCKPQLASVNWKHKQESQKPTEVDFRHEAAVLQQIFSFCLVDNWRILSTNVHNDAVSWLELSITKHNCFNP